MGSVNSFIFREIRQIRDFPDLPIFRPSTSDRKSQKNGSFRIES